VHGVAILAFALSDTFYSLILIVSVASLLWATYALVMHRRDGGRELR
jgi:hypothetical protein